MNEFNLQKKYKWETAHEPLLEVANLVPSTPGPNYTAESAFYKLEYQTEVIDGVEHDLYRYVANIVLSGFDDFYFAIPGVFSFDNNVTPKVVSNRNGVEAFNGPTSSQTALGYLCSEIVDPAGPSFAPADYVISSFTNFFLPPGVFFYIVESSTVAAGYKHAATIRIDITIAIPHNTGVVYEVF